MNRSVGNLMDEYIFSFDGEKEARVSLGLGQP